MKDKNKVLVTGATGGVGSTLCRHLSTRYHVLAVGRDARRLEKLNDELPDIETFSVDLASHGAVASWLDELMAVHPYIPYVINNAGINVRRTTEELETEVLLASLGVNAIAPWMIMARLLPAMRERAFGRVVNITSGAPLNCFAGFSAYSASKAALNALTVTAAQECQDQDIRINLMSPGPVRSGMSPSATLEPGICLPTLDYLLSIDRHGPTGRFFWLGYEIPLKPDLAGVDWLNGKASVAYRKVL